MYIKIAILISIAVQVIAATYAVSLIRVSRYNISWIFLTLAFLFMAIRQLFEYFPLVYKTISYDVAMFNSWLGVVISILIMVSLMYIRKIFTFLEMSQRNQKQMERRILSTIISTEENERKRFAKDLHDGMGPLLSNLKMSVSALEKIGETEGNKEILANMKLMVNEAISGIKEISNNLSPRLLEDFGLLKATQHFVEAARSGSEIEIDLQSNIEEQRFNTNVEIVLYRIIIELINNTIKHADARHIRISIFVYGNLVTLEYADDGKGYSSETDIPEPIGMGLPNIRSRIKSLHGNVLFTGKPGEGFTAKIECPTE